MKIGGGPRMRFINKGWGVGEEAESDRVYRNTRPCARPGCGHPADRHKFLDFGKEGKCEESGCACMEFVAVPVEECWNCGTPYSGDPLGVTEPACDCGAKAESERAAANLIRP